MIRAVILPSCTCCKQVADWWREGGGSVGRERVPLDCMKSPSFFPICTDMQDNKEARCAGPDCQGVSKSKTFKGQFVDKLKIYCRSGRGWGIFRPKTPL